MEHQKLLELRAKIKKKKPNFVERESHHYPRIEAKWRFPRGCSSPIRRQLRGEPALVTTGYGSPREVRGLHSSGLEKVLVHNAAELRNVNPQKQGAVIASGLGNKKRAELLKIAIEKKIRVLNAKDSSKLLAKINGAFSSRKKKKEDRNKEKSKKLDEKKKKSEEKLKKEQEEKQKKEHDSQEESSEERIKAEEKIKADQQHLKEEVEKTIIKRQ